MFTVDVIQQHNILTSEVNEQILYGAARCVLTRRSVIIISLLLFNDCYHYKKYLNNGVSTDYATKGPVFDTIISVYSESLLFYNTYNINVLSDSTGKAPAASFGARALVAV